MNRMFDPTVFDNVKVVFEGSVYDLDLEGLIDVTGRNDIMDLSLFSRTYRVRFRLKGSNGTEAELLLGADLANLASEILEQSGPVPGCTLSVRFAFQTGTPEISCAEAERLIRGIWGEEYKLTQQVKYSFGERQALYHIQAELHFHRLFTESLIEDIPELLSHVMLTLQQLDK
ncbi:hypothetical protein [Paenibacillus gansuensis]|uniref:Uncharacterized protein n=1 Tax=Paenibacillus gansuensis TaxID=306542 RepID=A0ABW5PB61_9BACL